MYYTDYPWVLLSNSGNSRNLNNLSLKGISPCDMSFFLVILEPLFEGTIFVKKICMKYFVSILFTFIFLSSGLSQHKDSDQKSRFTLSGFIKDEKGEALIGANIYVESIQSGTVSNPYGFYSLTLPEGIYLFRYSFLGYQSREIEINLHESVNLNVNLESKSEILDGVEIKAYDDDSKILKQTEMSSFMLQSKKVKLIPTLLGESDIIKAIQLLPGVQATGEGLSGFNVRGGNHDQNLILLDEGSVYNASHLIGFFSIFNNDVIKDAKLYKGDLPAQYGGRLSSLLDIRMRDGNRNKFSGSGGIGTIASKLALEGPILNKKGSVIAAGRRSYADIFLPLSKNEEIKDNNLYFYDLNFKANVQINENNRVFLSSYIGRDVFKYQNQYYMTWGNVTETFRWNHLFSNRLFSNFSFIYSDYDYRLGQTADITGVEWKSSLADLGFKYDFTFYPNPKNTIRFGITTSLYNFKPGYIKATSDSSIFNNYEIPRSRALEHSIYLSNEQKIGRRLAIEYGLRYSVFQNIGQAIIYNFNEKFEKVDSSTYRKGEIFNTYSGIEPRLRIRFSINPKSSIKGSFVSTRQYLHLISNSTAGTPIDIWLPSNPNIKPQRATQFTVGYFRNFPNKSFEISIEGYYKDMQNQIDYKDHADIILNPELEGELRFGIAWAYGLEILIQKTEGKLTGWIGYGLSKADKKFPDVNLGKVFPANYDKRHDLSIVTNYRISSRLTASLNWVYISGAPVTFPTGRYMFGNMVIPVYSERNGYRMPDYHRLDLAVNLKGKKKPDRKITGEWNFSVYNAYNRKNAWMIYFKANEDNPKITEAYKLYMFPVIPAISYNFKF